MKVTLVTYTPDPVVTIGQQAAICYDSDTSPEASRKRAAKCKDSGHLATLRFATATFHIEGISRYCSHQLVRSKHLDFLQRSQRYVKATGDEFIQPDSLSGMPEPLLVKWAHLEQMSREVYAEALASGMRKEDARFALLGSAETELYVVGNFQAWQDFIRLRADKHAQWEIRAVALKVQQQLHRIAPELFDAPSS